MAAKSWTGWLVLIVALGIPSALFYQWHSRVDEASRQEGSVKVRLSSRPFPLSNEKDRLVSPLSAQPDLPAPAPAPLLTAPAPAAPAQPQKPAVAGALASALAAIPAASLPPVPAAKDFAEWRDPTLSPFDIRSLEEKRIEAELAKAALQPDALKRMAARSKPRPSPEKSVVLQGIIYIDAGNHSAIVNGETVHEGEVIKTAAGAVKVLGITPLQVRFSLQGRRFDKSVDR